LTNIHSRTASPRVLIGFLPGNAGHRKPNSSTGRRPNADLRTCEHLTETEAEGLNAAAKANRHGHRDATMVLVAYRHGRHARKQPIIEKQPEIIFSPGRPLLINNAPNGRALASRLSRKGLWSGWCAIRKVAKRLSRGL
jgi:hypothetical protein